MDWKREDKLGPGQTDHPVEFIGRLDGVELPPLDSRWCLEFWGDNKRTSRFKTFGHRDGKRGAHFIVARGGTAMHTDIGFARWSVHVQLFNGGYYTHGLDAVPEHYELLVPGVITVLDTHSPHKVSRDPRFGIQVSPSKVAMALDYDEYPSSIDEAVDELVDWLPSLAVPV